MGYRHFATLPSAVCPGLHGSLYTGIVVGTESTGRRLDMQFHELRDPSGPLLTQSASARSLRPVQTPQVSLDLLKEWRGASYVAAQAVTPAATAAVPAATASAVTAFALSTGYYAPGRVVDAWVRGGWWAAVVVREVPAHEHVVVVKGRRVVGASVAAAAPPPVAPAARQPPPPALAAAGTAAAVPPANVVPSSSPSAVTCSVDPPASLAAPAPAPSVARPAVARVPAAPAAVGSLGRPVRDVALRCISPGGAVSIHTAGVLVDSGRIFELRYVDPTSDAASPGVGPDAGRLSEFVPAARLRPAAAWSRSGGVWRLRPSLSLPPIVRWFIPASAGLSAALGSADELPAAALPPDPVLPAKRARAPAAKPDDANAATAPSPCGPMAVLHSDPRFMADAGALLDSSDGADTDDDGNDGHCTVCDDIGDIVCCDGCPRSFHAACFSPPLPADFPGHLICPACVLGAENTLARDKCCAGCGAPPPIMAPVTETVGVRVARSATAIVTTTSVAAAADVRVSAFLVSRCSTCNAGYLPCCLVEGFGPRSAALVLASAAAAIATVGERGSSVSQPSKADAAALSKLRCLRCQEAQSAGFSEPPGVERLLAHRIRFIRNACLDRTLGRAVTDAVSTAPLTSSAAKSSTGAARMSDCSFLPSFEFLVKWRRRGHWFDSWEPASLLWHVAPKLLHAYLRSHGIATACGDLAADVLRGRRTRKTGEAAHTWDARIVILADDDPARFAPAAFVRRHSRSVLPIVETLPPWARREPLPEGGLDDGEWRQPEAFSCLAGAPGVGCALPLPRFELAGDAGGAAAAAEAPARGCAAVMIEPSLYLEAFESRDVDTDAPLDELDDPDAVDAAGGDDDVERPATERRSLLRAHAADPDVVGLLPRDYRTLPVEGDFRPEFLVPDRVLAVRRRRAAADAASPLGAWDPFVQQSSVMDVLQRLRARAAVASPARSHAALGLVDANSTESLRVGDDTVAAALLRYDSSHAALRVAIALRKAALGDLEFLVRWRGAGADEATWEAAPLVAAVAPAAALRFFRLNGRCLRSSLRRERLLRGAGESGQEHTSVNAVAAGGAFGESPGFLGGTLFPYQLEGLNWLVDRYHARKSACLADEMGLGELERGAGIAGDLYHVCITQARPCKRLRSARLYTIFSAGHWKKESATWREGRSCPHQRELPTLREPRS